MLGIILVIFLSVLIYIFDRKQFKYWKRHGIPQLNPSFLIGDIKDLVLQKKQPSILFEEIYYKDRESPLIGLYFSYRPVIMIKDIELAKTILTKDFQCFYDRGFFIDTKIDPLTSNLFCLAGEKWRKMRQKVTPQFSASKLKMMLPIIQESFQLFENAVDEKITIASDCVIDIRDYTAKLALTMISSIAFGLHNDCINDPDNIFREKALKVLEPSIVPYARLMSALFMPKLCEKLKFGFFSKELNEYFIEITKKIVEFRENNEVERRDFLNLFMQLRKDNENVSGTDDFTLNDIAANSFIFVLAGYETTASTISYCLFELARNQSALRKVQEEIDEHADEDFSYEKIKKFKYLEKCINETLRKYPIIPFLNRVSSYDYQVPETSIVIPRDTPVIIPICAMQRDPKIYPNPIDFNPERFNEDTDIPLLSFGYGNRTCIGKRMAFIVAKCYIYDILLKYNISLESSDKEIEFSPKVASLTPSETILIKFTKRASSPVEI